MKNIFQKFLTLMIFSSFQMSTLAKVSSKNDSNEAAFSKNYSVEISNFDVLHSPLFCANSQCTISRPDTQIVEKLKKSKGIVQSEFFKKISD